MRRLRFTNVSIARNQYKRNDQFSDIFFRKSLSIAVKYVRSCCAVQMHVHFSSEKVRTGIGKEIFYVTTRVFRVAIKRSTLLSFFLVLSHA